MGHPFGLEGKRIAITGAGGGIGSATARLAAQLGASVLLSDLRLPEATADAVRSLGADCEVTALDVASQSAVEAWCDACGKVDAVIDCAAICPIDTWEDDGWNEVATEVFAVNLRGPLNLVRAFMRAMKANGGGRIALVGSLAGRYGGLLSSPHYVMSKGGIHAFVRWAARQGAPHAVLVNAVAPGPIATPMIEGVPFDSSVVPLGRAGQPEEVAGPLVFLVSSAASYITGAVLDINGGVHFS